MIDWSPVLSAANVVLGLLLAAYSWRYVKKSGPEYWRWLKFAYAVIGLYWAGLYLYVFCAGIGVLPASDPVLFGRLWVRPAFTLTLAVLSAGAIARVRKAGL